MATQESANTNSTQQNVKLLTLEKGNKRKYTRKSKTNQETISQVNQETIPQTNQETIPQVNQETIPQTNQETIPQVNQETNEQQEKYNQRIYELRNSGGDIETRLANQQEAYRLEKNIQKQDNKTIIERVKNAMVNTVNYSKFSLQEDKRTQATGKLIDLSLMEDDNLCIIDFDIKKQLPPQEIDTIRQNIIDSLPPNVGLVKTAHGGLHAYCNRDSYKLPSNRNVKVISRDNYDIDIFAQMNKYKQDGQLVQNRVVAPNSQIREQKLNLRIMLKYESINDWENQTHLASLRDILDSWNVDIEVSAEEYAQQQLDRKYVGQISENGTVNSMDDNLAQACVNGLKNLDIHNYPHAITKEVSLLHLFTGLHGITNEQIRNEGISNIRQFNKLTANADTNYEQAKLKGLRKPNPYILVKVLRYHNKEYYDKIIKPILKKNYDEKRRLKQLQINQTLVPNKIDLNDDFTLLHIQKKAASGQYENEEQIVLDLTKIIAYYAGETEDVYLIKEFDAICGTLVIHHKLEGTIYKQLEKVIITFKNQKTDIDNSKPLTAKSIFKKYSSKFVMKGCKFISDDPAIFSIFQGYKYKRLDSIDYECLQMYLDLIRETIAAGDEEVYDYIVNWIAYMIQNVGKKTKVAIVLQGRQGIGKNRFTDVIAELTNRYSCPNITNTEEFTGNFNSVVENKMFSVLNELRNYDTKKGLATIMKSVISDEYIRINEKNQPRRTAENVMNLIYVTNSDSPLQLDTDDRRHLVCACKTVHQVTLNQKSDVEYFNQLSQSYTQYFYENLMTFFLERDISQFNPTLIPMTEAKKQLINVSKSPIDNIIIEHFEQFKQGITVNLANQFKPSNWLQQTYRNAMEHKCQLLRPYINKIRTRVYVLNLDQQSYYNTMMNEDDIEIANKNLQKYKKQNEDDGFVEQIVQDTKV
ncbi:MAG: hypothetical protein EZS28_022082 [Streblomastix strix]|uniref:NrS-1 polymerase-like helicase domain-containing protein n=1 Tax=Streblomastix strix TaxID=222440 RepID=A0A5J4VIH1_9EUKA|nr:MAG: hypothetical protein EZS28_022082 [Streblomastix strix]